MGFPDKVIALIYQYYYNPYQRYKAYLTGQGQFSVAL